MHILAHLAKKRKSRVLDPSPPAKGECPIETDWGEGVRPLRLRHLPLAGEENRLVCYNYCTTLV